ncbi:hypothetical protein [Ferrimonas balearica]|uniref:hypothetical protein n=1 Tax=Ferrimonas balearica TaxID=44012 RepID=UPI001C98D103|nr:hypothetical protein [Ferrimonas balearica]MBY5981969.1 hypothetical protein [Ferrimonas balearica]
MKNVEINLHNLVRITGHLPQPLLTPLMERFGRFRGDASAAPWEIELGVLDAPGYRLRSRPGWVFDEIGAHWLGRSRKRLVIQATERGFRLLVRAPHYGRLHFGLLWALRILMARQGGALMHGAVLGDGQHTLMLLGAKRVGKTQLVLRLMEQQWQLLAEDKFLFLHGQAYCLQDHFYLRAHHLHSHPWLPRMLGPSERPGRRTGEAQWRAGVETLYPGQLALTLKPDRLAWLSPGEQWQHQPISPTALRQALVQQQRDAFAQFAALDQWQGDPVSLPDDLPLTGARHYLVPQPIDITVGSQSLRQWLQAATPTEGDAQAPRP